MAAIAADDERYRFCGLMCTTCWVFQVALYDISVQSTIAAQRGNHDDRPCESTHT